MQKKVRVCCIRMHFFLLSYVVCVSLVYNMVTLRIEFGGKIFSHFRKFYAQNQEIFACDKPISRVCSDRN